MWHSLWTRSNRDLKSLPMREGFCSYVVINFSSVFCSALRSTLYVDKAALGFEENFYSSFLKTNVLITYWTRLKIHYLSQDCVCTQSSNMSFKSRFRTAQGCMIQHRLRHYYLIHLFCSWEQRCFFLRFVIQTTTRRPMWIIRVMSARKFPSRYDSDCFTSCWISVLQILMHLLYTHVDKFGFMPLYSHCIRCVKNEKQRRKCCLCKF